LKNSIKKIICLIMAFCLLSGMLSLSTSAEEKSSDSEVFEAMEFLQLLKVIPENYYDYNTKMDEDVSRADYVDAVAKIIGSYDYQGSLYYYDVPETHYAYGSIAKLTEMKIINGVGDGLFRPDDAISGISAYKIILSLMGYNVMAEVDGGYPAGYIKIAKKLDIYDSELASGNLSRGGMIKLLYRAMKANIFDTTGYSGQGSVEYEVSEDETLLSVYHNIQYGEGVVTASDMITLSGETPGDSKKVGIDGVVYNSNVRLNEMLGEEVEYFILDDKSESRGTVLFAKPTGRSEVINIQADNISEFDKNTYTLSYYKSENSSTVSKVKLTRGITVIYNGVVVDKKIDEIFNSSDYSVKLIENNDEYDIAIVKQYENYVVGMIDSSSKAIFDKVKPEKILKLNERDYDYMSIRDLSGNEVEFTAISVDNVISAYISKDGKYMEAIVSDRQHSGELSNTKKSGNYLNLTVGGEMFKMKDDVETEPYKVGDNVVLYLDCMDKVAYLTVKSGDFFAAYAADGALIENGFESEYKIKLFKQDGNLGLYDFADRVKVDGSTIKDAEIIAKAFEYNGAFKRQLALFEVNSKGEIISVDTVEFNELKESKTNSLQKSMNVEPRAWRSGVGAFGIGLAAAHAALIRLDDHGGAPLQILQYGRVILHGLFGIELRKAGKIHLAALAVKGQTQRFSLAAGSAAAEALAAGGEGEFNAVKVVPVLPVTAGKAGEKKRQRGSVLFPHGDPPENGAAGKAVSAHTHLILLYAFPTLFVK